MNAMGVIKPTGLCNLCMNIRTEGTWSSEPCAARKPAIRRWACGIRCTANPDASAQVAERHALAGKGREGKTAARAAAGQPCAQQIPHDPPTMPPHGAHLLPYACRSALAGRHPAAAAAAAVADV